MENSLFWLPTIQTQSLYALANICRRHSFNNLSTLINVINQKHTRIIDIEGDTSCIKC